MDNSNVAKADCCDYPIITLKFYKWSSFKTQNQPNTGTTQYFAFVWFVRTFSKTGTSLKHRTNKHLCQIYISVALVYEVQPWYGMSIDIEEPMSWVSQ